ncbi:MAG TPA: allophanate hydrolase [Verrucomicrobiales bacterium]|nr:allophanate hydrolase [Verrucomicrobiales bacterium]
MKWVSYGPNALLVEFADRLGDEAFARGRSIVAALERRPPEGLVEFVPGFTSVLLEFDPLVVPDPKARVLEWMAMLKSAISTPAGEGELKTLPVTYDGPDLERVARQGGLTPEMVVALHSGRVYKVYVLGFSPGFPYLGDLDPRLQTPRLATPRTRVPAGSVAIGGEHTGIYPTETAGGWNLIGRTPRVLFDPGRASAGEHGREAFLLRPGDRVQFVPQPGGAMPPAGNPSPAS